MITPGHISYRLDSGTKEDTARYGMHIFVHLTFQEQMTLTGDTDFDV